MERTDLIEWAAKATKVQLESAIDILEMAKVFRSFKAETPAAAAVVKRKGGPGRKKGSKNKPKAAAAAVPLAVYSEGYGEGQGPSNPPF